MTERFNRLSMVRSIDIMLNECRQHSKRINKDGYNFMTSDIREKFETVESILTEIKEEISVDTNENPKIENRYRSI